ncbi:hypothetical protein IMG5_194950 [Ichthyophthirius multifiliis]|uniref:Uncharacterized protein n=1 Tax=Ichthyophthirius multifiliis TaxID=5932 RepID=G0R4U9_ICHMU|nr:hypothetical protein IMG5_194950 [Ichthyophthirius multifiliis]EGR27492.1 hypothetical protein IMG5_194950 [Ichthyophthirius multifiliis]|eukprot:XP_004024402.1 hypothetical protein IMG5_194950 [Ichthyophthirius multifiliis]
MFNDAAKTRRVTFDYQYQDPISVNEIWMAVQLHYKINNNHDWIENPKPYRNYWVILLEKAGENLPKKHDLPKIKIQPVFDLYQKRKQIQTFYPQTSVYNSTVKQNKKLIYIFIFQSSKQVTNQNVHIQVNVNQKQDQQSIIQIIQQNQQK